MLVGATGRVSPLCWRRSPRRTGSMSVEGMAVGSTAVRWTRARLARRCSPSPGSRPSTTRSSGCGNKLPPSATSDACLPPGDRCFDLAAVSGTPSDSREVPGSRPGQTSSKLRIRGDLPKHRDPPTRRRSSRKVRPRGYSGLSSRTVLDAPNPLRRPNQRATVSNAGAARLSCAAIAGLRPAPRWRQQ